MTDVRRPIMIVCAGRSGSTVYYRMLSRHRDTGFLSTYNEAFPSQTWLSVLSRLYEQPMLGPIRDHRVFPKPFSPYTFWQQFLPDIARHDRPPGPDEIPDDAMNAARRTISRVLAYQGKTRFVFKVTGWARMALFDKIFPDIRFIWLSRNPIDVVSSWLRVGRLNVTSAPDSEDWEWGDVPGRLLQTWREMGGGPLLSAAVKTELDLADIRRNMKLFPGRCLECRYEDLVRRPLECMRETLAFCDLQWDDDFESIVRTTELHHNVDKWRKYLSVEDGDLVKEFFSRCDGRRRSGQARVTGPCAPVPTRPPVPRHVVGLDCRKPTGIEV